MLISSSLNLLIHLEFTCISSFTHTHKQLQASGCTHFCAWESSSACIRERRRAHTRTWVHMSPRPHTHAVRPRRCCTDVAHYTETETCSLACNTSCLSSVQPSGLFSLSSLNDWHPQQDVMWRQRLARNHFRPVLVAAWFLNTPHVAHTCVF